MLSSMLSNTVKKLASMIVFFMVINIVYGIILMNFHLEILEEIEELGLAAFFLQTFRISLGDFLVSNFAIKGASSLTLFSFYINTYTLFR